MKKLTIKNEITSLELTEQINIFRKEEGTKTELRHKDLLNIIRDEFSEEINERKISPVEYKDKKGQLRPMFNLTLSQAKQVLVRESKFVRRAIIQYIEKLEKSLIEATEITMTVPIKVPNEINLNRPTLFYQDIIIEQVKGFNTKNGKRYELGILAVSGRQLWEKLRVKTRFTEWIKRRIDKYGFQEDVDYIWYGDDYALTIDMAGELALIENTQIGRELRRYLINYERSYKRDEYEKQQVFNNKIEMLEKAILAPNITTLPISKNQETIDKLNANIKTINHINNLIKEDFAGIQKLINKLAHKEAEKMLYINQLERIINL